MASLSNSDLWSKMQEYYSNMGPEAWQDEVVPSQITSNKTLANAYANVIVGAINDWQQQNPNSSSDQPFYIIEIGAGHGKSGYFVLKSLAEQLSNFDLPLTTVKYVMTDISTKNIASMSKHPALQSWVAADILDFANFNATADNSLNLIHSKEVISTKSLDKPVIMICNYLFDSLAHDAFQVRDHELYETQIKINSDSNWQEYFEKAKFEYNHEKVSSTDYYPDQNLNKILEFYTKHFNVGSFMIPTGGITAVNTLESFTKENLILLLADKGVADLKFSEDLDDPDIQIHGSISLVVNFDAVGRYFELRGGKSLFLPNRAAEFQVGCFVSSASYPVRHTQQAFHNCFYGASPQDIIHLCYINDEPRSNFSNLDEVLALLNLSSWDPAIFYDIHEQILDFIEDDDDENDDEDSNFTLEQERCILNNIGSVWDYFYKLEKEQDLPFSIASVFYALDHFEKALYYYKLSIEHFGENAENLYNLALCYQMLDQLDNSRIYANKSISLDPNYTPSKELLMEL